MPKAVYGTKRLYLAVSTEHLFSLWSFGKPLLLLGKRSLIGEKRTFDGHTFFPDDAELYSIEDMESGIQAEKDILASVIAKIDITYPEYYRHYKYILIKYNDYIRYCKTFGLPLRISSQ